jgi:hypothetical protein
MTCCAEVMLVGLRASALTRWGSTVYIILSSSDRIEFLSAVLHSSALSTQLILGLDSHRGSQPTFQGSCAIVKLMAVS